MFWQFWGPTIAFALTATGATAVGLLPLKLRDLGPATAAELLARGLWSLAAVFWFAWTIPNAAQQFFTATRAVSFGTMDFAELVFRASMTPARADAAFDWWCGFVVALATLTALDALAFHLLYRRGYRVAARAVSGGVTALLATPVWLALLLVVAQMTAIWRSVA